MEQSVKSLPDKTSYRISGKGKPVILLHGFGEDGNIWQNQLEELSKYFQCIVPDLPGTGISNAAFSNLTDLSIEALAEKIKEIAHMEKIRTFTILGHSMGGYITLAFAEKYPGMLNGFGLIHSSAYADNEEKINTRKRSIEFIRNLGAAKFLEQMIPGLYGERFKSECFDQISQHITRSLGFDAEVLITYYEMMIKRPDRTQLLSSFQKPILFIMGTEDKAVNLSDSLAQCHLPVESHIEILESSGHMGMIENSERTTIAMKKFLMHLNEN
jgi:pimeloyl-ACP methyl ester carboxylesterase